MRNMYYYRVGKSSHEEVKKKNISRKKCMYYGKIFYLLKMMHTVKHTLTLFILGVGGLNFFSITFEVFIVTPSNFVTFTNFYLSLLWLPWQPLLVSERISSPPF